MSYIKTFSQGFTVVVYLILSPLPNAVAADIQLGLDNFKNHYHETLGDIQVEAVKNSVGGGERFVVKSAVLKGEGNYPNIKHHGVETDDVVILVHGLTDSPYYMRATT